MRLRLFRVGFCLGSVLLFFGLYQPSHAQSGVAGDANRDSAVDGSDYLIWLSNFGLIRASPHPTILQGNFNDDEKVDGSDYLIWLSNFGKAAPTPTPVRTTPGPTIPPGQATEWTQFGHDAQRTSFTAQAVTLPWKYKWQWNGAGADGKKQAGHLSVPTFVQPITGGNRIYYIAGNVVYAFDKNGNTTDPNNKTGNVLWSKGALGTLNSTPVYYNENIFVAGDSTIYKLNAANGSQMASFPTDGNIAYAPLLVGTNIYVVNAKGKLYSIDATNMTQNWVYTGNSAGATPPSYSNSRGLIIYLTQDLYVHAVNSINGTGKWRVKPTPRNYECTAASDSESTSCNVVTTTGAQAENGWPVVAEQHGIVFVRYRIDRETYNQYPNTNAEIRAQLEANPAYQVLFALSLDTGQKAFVPAVGNAGAGDGGYLPMGQQPVIKIAGGQEVAYVIWRSAQTCMGCTGGGVYCCEGNIVTDTKTQCTDLGKKYMWCDGREDAVLGEMVLDSTHAISGCANTPGTNCEAGDVRFVGDGIYSNSQTDIQTDEAGYTTMSNDIIFHSHWVVSQTNRIPDANRANGFGVSFKNPIKTVPAPSVIWRQCYCADSNPVCNPQSCSNCGTYKECPSNCPFNASTRYCYQTQGGQYGLYTYGDQRGYSEGFYEYHSDSNGGSKSFTVVSNGLVLVKTEDGGLIVLENGNPTSAEANFPQQLTQKATSSETKILGTTSPAVVPYTDASLYVDQYITATGVIRSAVNRLPKAIYLGFKDPHDGELLVRIFAKDISKFSYDPMTLNGKNVEVTGKVTLYWPESVDPEIIVTDPAQINIIK